MIVKNQILLSALFKGIFLFPLVLFFILQKFQNYANYASKIQIMLVLCYYASQNFQCFLVFNYASFAKISIELC